MKLVELHFDQELFDVPTFTHDIYVSEIDRVVGRIEYRIETGIDLMYYGNIGYVIYLPYRGNNYAYEAVKLFLELLKEKFPDLTEVYFTCNPDNHASRRTIEKLDAKFLELIDVDKKHELYQIGDKQKNVYVKILE